MSNPPPEDTFSNTVADAASYEAWYSEQAGDYVDDDTDFVYEDDYCDDDYEEDEEYDICGCSDPGCPCDGPKREGSP